tara:strand:- start:65 stop:481 length:417 start_codon:yes stop_codon:yes gene_type:complete
MPLVTLVFPFEINVSVQVRDVVYFVPTAPVGISGSPTGSPWESTTTPHWTGSRNAIVEIGPVTSIIPWNGVDERIIANMPQLLINQYGLPTGFIMFSKDNKANLSSLLGYYALTKFRNNSTEKGEIFSVGTDFFESSK